MKWVSNHHGRRRSPALLGLTLAAALASLIAVRANATAGRVAAEGSVVDASNRPVADATVVVYSAGVRKGYSRFCPTCYADCGKRARTDSAGHFSIAGLDDDLIFNLLIVRDGFSPKVIAAVDPLKGAVGPTAIKPRTFSSDPRREVHAKVVDATGMAVPYVLVETQGATFVQDGQVVPMFGGFGADDSLAVANENGEFALPVSRPVLKVLLRLSARAKAPRIVNIETGLDSTTLVVGDGATVRGRLLKRGTAVPNVELNLRSIGNMSGTIFPEEHVSTDENGRFSFTSVPVGRVWNLSASIRSLAGRGAVAALPLATEEDGQDVNVGDVRVQKGLILAGRIELTDGKPVPEGMSLTFQSGELTGQVVMLGRNGTFDIRGIMPGAYLIYPAVKGYSAPDKPYFEVLANHDTSNLVLRLQPDLVIH